MVCIYLFNYRKSKKSLTKNTVLSKALKTERKRRAAISLKLKKLRAEKEQLKRSMLRSENFRHSTMREDQLSNENNSLLLTSMNHISFASLNLPECKPIDGEEDIDRRSFEKWAELLEASLQLVGVLDEVTKYRIFKIKAGSKLLDVLDGTTSTADAPDAIMAPFSNAIRRKKQIFFFRFTVQFRFQFTTYILGALIFAPMS